MSFFFKEIKNLGETSSSLMYMQLECQKERSKMTKKNILNNNE